MAAKNTSKTKKSSATKKTAKPSKKVEPVMEMPAETMAETTISKQNTKQTFNLIVGALVFVVLAMGFVRFKYLFLPATVNGSPIYSWQYVKALNQTAGKQVLDQLVVERLVAQEADKQNITLSKEEVDAEFARLDKQFESVGGLEAFLSSQGLKKSDIQTQLELNLKVQKIVASNIVVSDEDVNKYYEANKADYKNEKVEDAKAQIKQMLQDQAMQQQISTWIQDLRSKAKVVVNLPNNQ